MHHRLSNSISPLSSSPGKMTPQTHSKDNLDTNWRTLERTELTLNSFTGKLTVRSSVESTDGVNALWYSIRVDFESVTLLDGVVSICRLAVNEISPHPKVSHLY